MKWGYLGVVVAVLAIVLISGCTQPSATGKVTATTEPTQEPTTSTTQEQPVYTPPCNAESIQTFLYAPEGDLIRFYFVLQDSSGANTPCSGNVSLEIADNQENLIYSSNFSVSSSEYVDYEFKLTGQGMGKAYEWRINKNEIKKGYSSFGNAKIIITAGNKKLTSETSMFDLPAYTEEEITQLEEDAFSEIATNINKNLTKGNFSVTILRAGYVTKTDYSGKKSYLRVDLKVKNVGSETEYFSPSGMAILAENQQYDSSWGGTLDTFSQIYPNVEKEGYVLFEGVTEDKKNLKLVFELGYDSSFNQYPFEYDIILN